ncbi:MAG: chalcone isomerase family protein [Bacteriovorax sp.]|nr:chalcone isomerase family protein [Bacteriovorax sp.]
MKLIYLLIAFSLSFSSFSNELSRPPLRGEGEYKWFFFNVYEVKLWAPSAENLYSNSLLLEIKYKKSFKGIDIVKQSEKELVHAGVDSSVVSKWKGKLLEIFPDVKAGDRILASFLPSEGITFYLNSTKELGRIVDLSFSKSFLDIWLGDKTSDPDLRDKLLGRKL